jgi:septal ring factor EnvC (AmiA/AmiB activator)
MREKREQNLTLTLPEKKDSGSLLEDSFDVPDFTAETELAISRAGDLIARMGPAMEKALQQKECWKDKNKRLQERRQGLQEQQKERQEQLQDQQQQLQERQKEMQEEQQERQRELQEEQQDRQQELREEQQEQQQEMQQDRHALSRGWAEI